MSEVRRAMLVGATGLVGRSVMQAAIEHPLVQLVALSRREAPLPLGGRLEMLVAGTADWPDAIGAIAPDSVICALGTTWRQSGEDEASFRSVDFDLVMTVAAAAKDTGATNFVLVSSAGADLHAKSLYLRVKSEVEAALGKLRFKRLDILRPGLLKGERAEDRRPPRAPRRDRQPAVEPRAARGGQGIPARSTPGSWPTPPCNARAKRRPAASSTTTMRSTARCAGSKGRPDLPQALLALRKVPVLGR